MNDYYAKRTAAKIIAWSFIIISIAILLVGSLSSSNFDESGKLDKDTASVIYFRIAFCLFVVSDLLVYYVLRPLFEFLLSNWNSNPLLKYLAASFVGALAGLVLADFLPQTLVASTVNDAMESAIDTLPIAENIQIFIINININFHFTFAISGAGIGPMLLKIWRKIMGTTTEPSKA